MAKGVNKVILVGNLGADPETRYAPSGGAVCELRLATSEQWTDKQTGQRQERVEWHTVALFGRLAEVAGEYLRKGRQVYIEGQLRTDEFTDREGIKRYRTKVIAAEMQMLGTASGDGSGESRQGQGRGARGRSGGDSERGYREASTGARAAQSALGEGDDVPF